MATRNTNKILILVSTLKLVRKAYDDCVEEIFDLYEEIESCWNVGEDIQLKQKLERIQHDAKYWDGVRFEKQRELEQLERMQYFIVKEDE